MAIETVLLAVGTATAKAVARMWLKSEGATDLSDTLIEQMSGRVPGLLERRRAARQFQEMADRIAIQVEPLVKHEIDGLPENEKEAAILGVAQVIDSLQTIDAQTLFAIDLEPTALEAQLRASDSMRVRGDLMPSAQLLFDVLLRESSNYIVELTINMPQFHAQALVELLRRGTEIMDRVDMALARLPAPAAAQADADQDFDVRYRRHVARELDQLELFGLTLSETAARYDLSIAYITLSAELKGEDEAGREKASVELGVIEETDDGSPTTDSPSEAYLRVDDALVRGQRHLIRGEAGSGKTTLLQWLAVSAARQNFQSNLQDWGNGKVPFFLQLRRYANQSLPVPSQFLAHTASLIADAMPVGWVDRRLRSGDGLVLIDGVDELPEQQRDGAREWLRVLMEEYPECTYIVTTRPPAVPENWLESSQFAIFELLPMSLSDIDSFIQHWYDAARRASIHDEQHVQVLDRYQFELARVIRENSAIRSLATAPLLCAMLCALNRDRRTQLPKDRMELYRIALESLLDRRDVEREISQFESVSLGLREKETLLEDLAYWLMLNDQTDVAKSDAVRHIDARLKYMTSINSRAEAVFSHLLVRSGLIREPVEGRIDFIHRTFQEYLAASRAMKEGNVPHLVEQAHNDQWREVIILSAGHAAVDQADALLNGLIDRGHAQPDHKHRLHLLAVACLETAVELRPETIARVREALRGALPPTNMTEARAVASAGPVAAPLLTQFTRGYATTAAACVRALCLIGGDAALAALREFSKDRRVTVTRELIRGWEYFDRDAYAAQILAQCSLDYGRITTADIDALASVHHLQRMKALDFTFSGARDEFVELENTRLITELTLTNASDWADLEPLASLPDLRSLKVAANDRAERIPSLSRELSYVELSRMTALTDMSALRGRANLRHARISGCPVDASELEGTGLQVLSLGAVRTLGDGKWLSSLRQLQVLSIDMDSSPPAVSDGFALGDDGSCGYLANRSLRQVSVWGPLGVVSLDGLGSAMNFLSLYEANSLRDASALRGMSSLRRLVLDGAEKLDDFTFLNTQFPILTHLDLERCERFADLSPVLSAGRISQLLLGGTSVTDISDIGRLTRLRLLSVYGCPIESFEPLLEFPPKRLLVTITGDQASKLSEEVRAHCRWRVIMDTVD